MKPARRAPWIAPKVQVRIETILVPEGDGDRPRRRAWKRHAERLERRKARAYRRDKIAWQRSTAKLAGSEVVKRRRRLKAQSMEVTA